MSGVGLAWLVCLAVTLAFELPIAAIGLGRAALDPRTRTDRDRWRCAAVALVANVVTHPLVWTACRTWPTPRVAFGAELFAVGVEALAYARWLAVPWPLALGVSLVANGVSLGACLFAPMP